MTRSFAVVAASTVLAVGTAAAATLGALRSGPLSVFTYPVEIVVDLIPAEVRIEPETLHRRSEGDHVTAFVSLPDGVPADEIDGASVRICEGSAPCSGGVAATRTRVIRSGRTLRAEFPRAEVLALLASIEAPTDVTLTVSGLVSSPPTRFAGSDQVRLIDP